MTLSLYSRACDKRWSTTVYTQHKRSQLLWTKATIIAGHHSAINSVGSRYQQTSPKNVYYNIINDVLLCRLP